MRIKHQGLTLIELMIVILIIGILAAVAYPSYQDQVRETKKTDGIIMINKVIQAQERYFVNTLTYTNDLTDLGYTAASDVPSEKGFYLISAETCGGGVGLNQCVNITSDAQGSQDTGTPAEDDLELNSQGTKAGKWPNDHQPLF